MSETAKKKKKKKRIPAGNRLRGVKVALDPTPRQIGMLEAHAGAARFAYNTALAHVANQLNCVEPAPEDGIADWSMYALRKWWNTWKDDLAPWWRENSKEAYASGLQGAAEAFSNYFNSRNGQRKGERMGWPQYKAKHHSTMKFTYTTGSYGLIDGDQCALLLPRIGRVHTLENVYRRVHGGKVSAMTIRYEHGRWWATLRVEERKPAKNRNLHGHIGIDLNVGDNLATLSDGTVIDNPKYLKQAEHKLKKLQHYLSKRQPGSNRWLKLKQRVDRLHARIVNQRLDLRHKLTTWLANTYEQISIEDLNVKGMTATPKPIPDPEHPGQYLKNGHTVKSGLNKAILDAGFGDFRRQLEYKCEQTGSVLHVIDRWYASSKTCSGCGTVKTKLSLDQRIFTCDSCGLTIGRDLNAAINIDAAGSTPARNARGANQQVPETPASQPERNAYHAPERGKTRSILGDQNHGITTQPKQTEL